MSVNASEVFPLTVTIPASFEQTSMIDVIDSYASVQATYVERGSIYEVSDTWRNACGFYILFSPINGDGSYNVYVGKSDKDFTKRLRSHDQNKEGWVTALLVQRVSMEGLSSTQSSFLEGALRDVFDRAAHVTCHNIARTGDWTLPDHEKLLMKQVIESTLRIMHLRGYRTSLTKKPVAPMNAPEPETSTPSFAPPTLTMSVPSTPKTPSPEPSAPPVSSGLPFSAPSTSTPNSEPVVTIPPTVDTKKLMFSLFGKKKSAPKPPPSPEEVFAALLDWRKAESIASRQKYRYILEDYTLRALSEKMPATYDDLLQIPGIKAVKREKYGKSLLQVLDKYRS